MEKQYKDVPNKVSFTSVSMKENSKGSPVVTLRLGSDQAEKMASLLGTISEENEFGANIIVQIIPGKKYDSAYAYVNPKNPPQDRPQTKFSKFGNKKPANKFGASKTTAYLKSKQLDSESAADEEE